MKRAIIYLVIILLFIVAVILLVQKKAVQPMTANVANITGSSGALSYVGARNSGTPRFGFNGIFIEGIVRDKNFNDAVNALGSVMDVTGAVWLRFPGGTRANEYVFDLAAPGLGGDTSFDKSFTQNFIVDYGKIARTTRAKTAYVMNLAAHFPTYYGGVRLMPPRLQNKTDSEIIAMNINAVAYLLDQGVDVPVIELGNELPLYNLSANRNTLVYNKTLAKTEVIMKPEIDRYADLVNQYKTALENLAAQKTRELGRTITFSVGVPIMTPPSDPSRANFIGPYGSRNTYWNSRMAQLPVDALIVHDYGDTSKCRTILNKDQQSLCMQQKATEDLANKPNMINRVKALAKDKEIWITEFNIGLGFSATDSLQSSLFVNSQSHVDYLRQLVKIYEQNGIDLYLLHYLYASQGKYSVVNNVSTTSGATRLNTVSALYAQPTICSFINTISSDFTKFKCK